MMILERIQALIHATEVGGGTRILRIVAIAVAMFALIFLYDLRAYKNFSSPEAMDSAQLARNLSRGKGFTTEFIRPFSLYLIQTHNQVESAGAPATVGADFARVKTAHPDIANAPVYPVVLAGLMEILPFRWPVEMKKQFWSDNEQFARYEPEMLIALFNQLLLVAAAAATFFLARKLFDVSVAWISSMLVIGCELLWRFSASGLSTLLLLLIFLGLFWCLLKIEAMVREGEPPVRLPLAWAAAAGMLAGLGALTRYSFGGVIIPVCIFLILFGGQRRLGRALTAAMVFVLVLTPWTIRNYWVSGTPFGTAGYALVEGSTFSGTTLAQSLQPNLIYAFSAFPWLHKFSGNLREIFQHELPQLGGSWAGMLFLVGWLLSFRSAAAQRLRYFLLMCLATFVVFQAGGRTSLSDASPEINSENLLVLVVPVAFIYATAFFLTLLEQLNLTLLSARYALIAVFVGVCCLPMIAVLWPPKRSPVAYPPYNPPAVQALAHWMSENEMMMSDLPWAVAWYGDRQCVWLSLDWQDAFNDINKKVKPVQALYLSHQAMDGKYVSEWLEGGQRSWGGFILQVLNDRRVPEGFPLTKAPAGLFPENLFLADRDRWSAAP